MDGKTIWQRLGAFGRGPTRLMAAGCLLSLGLSAAALTAPSADGVALAVAALREALLCAAAAFGWDLWLSIEH